MCYVLDYKLFKAQLPKKYKYFDTSTGEQKYCLSFHEECNPSICVPPTLELQFSEDVTNGHKETIGNTNPYDLARVSAMIPHVNGPKHGWCIDYRDYHKNHKRTEGWYTNGKRQGVHRVYNQYVKNGQGLLYDLDIFLYSTSTYVDDVSHGITTTYDVHGNVVVISPFVNNVVHGIVHLVRECQYQLVINGVVKIFDLENELHIDPKNLTDADNFTLIMLGL